MTIVPQHAAEVLSIATADGQKLPFAGAWIAQGFANFGAAPVNYQTQSGYKQIGSQVLDYNLTERRMTILIRAMSDDPTRPAYWSQRAEILDFFRPNRGTDGNELTLTIGRLDENGDVVRRSIQCRYESGLEFEDFDNDVNDFIADAGINVIAHNPIWYDSSETILTPSASSSDNLVFPITFPIVFGTPGLIYDTGDLAYTGSWRAYPTMTITGPYTTCTLENLGTGASLDLLVQIGAGDSRIITLSEQRFSIVDNMGDSKFDELSLTSNLKDFFIPTSGEVIAGGAQQIQARLLGASESQSAFEFRYKTAYYGI